MSKIAVVYYSGTGNTEEMASAVADGARSGGAEVNMISCSDFTAEMVDMFDAFAFGCPSMGAEQLESDLFQPMWENVKNILLGKKVALFGSYGWGDGEWMRNWLGEAESLDIVGSCICNESPDANAIVECGTLGKSLNS